MLTGQSPLHDTQNTAVGHHGDRLKTAVNAVRTVNLRQPRARRIAAHHFPEAVKAAKARPVFVCDPPAPALTHRRHPFGIKRNAPGLKDLVVNRHRDFRIIDRGNGAHGLSFVIGQGHHSEDNSFTVFDAKPHDLRRKCRIGKVAASHELAVAAHLRSRRVGAPIRDTVKQQRAVTGLSPKRDARADCHRNRERLRTCCIGKNVGGGPGNIKQCRRLHPDGIGR